MGFQGICGRGDKSSLLIAANGAFPKLLFKFLSLKCEMTSSEHSVWNRWCYICSSFPWGCGQAPGEVNRRAGRGEHRLRHLAFFCLRNAIPKTAPENESWGGRGCCKERMKTLTFSFLKSGNYLLHLQRRNCPEKGKKAGKYPNPPTGLSAGTNKQND